MSDGRIDGDQFREWLRHHTALFPGIQQFLDRLPKAGLGTGITPDLQEQMRAWHKQLMWYTLDELKAASELLSEREAEKDRVLGYGRHVAAIAKIAKSEIHKHKSIFPTPVYQDGEQVYECNLCRDEGRRIAWHAMSIRYALSRVDDGLHLGDSGTLYQTAVACTCSTGRYFGRKMTTFDERLHLPLERWEDSAGRYVIGQMADPAEQGRLVAWAQARAAEGGRQQKPAEGQAALPF